MRFSPLTFYVLAAICQTAGSSGAAMLAPFFMKEHGYSVAIAGIPLVANGIGRVCSDVLSGVLATYFSPGFLLVLAMMLGLATSAIGYAFMNSMSVFLAAWIVFGLTEAMFALSLRKIGFDQSAPERQGRVQGQMASALGIGFTIGPLLGYGAPYASFRQSARLARVNSSSFRVEVSPLGLVAARALGTRAGGAAELPIVRVAYRF